MSFTAALILREGDRQRLADLTGLPSVPPGLAKRARIVLLAADGKPNAKVARMTGADHRPGSRSRTGQRAAGQQG
jgi:hypothetical protein